MASGMLYLIAPAGVCGKGFPWASLQCREGRYEVRMSINPMQKICSSVREED